MASKHSTETPPRGGVTQRDEVAAAAAEEAARSFPAPQPSFPMGGMRADPGAALGEPRLAPSFDPPTGGALVPYEQKPPPTNVFDWIDRGWRPGLGLICGVGFFYSFVAAPVTDRREVDEAKLWVLCTLALGLAGAKTAERIGPGMMRPQALLGPPLVTR